MDPESHVGRRVREVRSWRGLTLTAAAQLAGMSAANLSRIEHGQQGLSRKGTLESLAAALRVAPSELTGQPLGPTTPGEAEGHAAVEGLRGVLRDIDLDVVDLRLGVADVEGFGALNDEIAQAAKLNTACDYGALGDRVPSLVARAHLRAAASPQARLLLIRALMPAFYLAKDLGHHDVGWSVALHLHAAATAVGDPAWIGVANFLLAEAMTGTDARQRALEHVEQAAADVSPAAGTVGEAYGLLRLSAALQSAVLGHTDAVGTFLDDATDVARHTGDGTFADQHFGPRNVGVWRVGLAVETGDVESVPDLARAVEVDAIPSQGRQASFYIDLGRGLAARRGRETSATEAFRRAEELAPQLVHANPYVRETVGDLLRRARRDAGGRELRGMAHRLGLGV